MINQPPIDELTEKAGDKYSLCCVVAKRAKELAQNPDAPAYFKAISYAELTRRGICCPFCGYNLRRIYAFRHMPRLDHYWFSA